MRSWSFTLFVGLVVACDTTGVAREHITYVVLPDGGGAGGSVSGRSSTGGVGGTRGGITGGTAGSFSSGGPECTPGRVIVLLPPGTYPSRFPASENICVCTEDGRVCCSGDCFAGTGADGGSDAGVGGDSSTDAAGETGAIGDSSAISDAGVDGA